MNVLCTIDDQPVELTDWQADSSVNWGYRSLTGKIPDSCTWAEQEAPVKLWLQNGDQLWAGTITQDPWGSEGTRNLRASGYATQIAASKTRMFYRIDGGASWSEASEDPFIFGTNEKYDLFNRPGALMFRWGNNADAFTSGNLSRFAIWVEGGLITRYSVLANPNVSITNFDFVTRRFTAPGGSETAIDTHSLAIGSPTTYANDIATPEDALSFVLRANVSSTPNGRRSLKLSSIRVYGRTTDDAFSASDVVADVGSDASLGISGVQSSALAVLPLDWTEDHTSLLTYMAELTDWHWEALDQELVFGPWTTTWTGFQGNGVTPDWEPQERYNKVVVPFRYVSGAAGEAEASPAVDPFPGKDVAFYADELEHPQQDSTLAAAAAAAQVEYRASVRAAGRIKIGRVMDAVSRPASGYEVRPGHLINVADRPDLGPQRIVAMTYRANEVTAEINDDFNAVRMLAEIRGDRPRNRRKKQRRRPNG